MPDESITIEFIGEGRTDRGPALAAAIRDLNAIEARCPIGFAPFAEEVRIHLRPLFEQKNS